MEWLLLIFRYIWADWLLITIKFHPLNDCLTAISHIIYPSLQNCDILPPRTASLIGYLHGNFKFARVGRIDSYHSLLWDSCYSDITAVVNVARKAIAVISAARAPEQLSYLFKIFISRLIIERAIFLLWF